MPEEPNTTAAQPDPEPDPQTPDDSPRDPAFAAVNVCRGAYFDAYEEYENNNGGPDKVSEYLCKEAASDAYRDKLPTLSNRQNILNFIACVAEGVLLEAIPESASGKLIYAAQAALGALPREPKPTKKTKKRTPPHPRGAKKVNSEDSVLTSSIQAA